MQSQADPDTKRVDATKISPDAAKISPDATKISPDAAKIPPNSHRWHQIHMQSQNRPRHKKSYFYNINIFKRLPLTD